MEIWQITADGEPFEIEVPSSFEELRSKVASPEDLFILARQSWVEKVRQSIRVWRRSNTREETERLAKEYIYSSPEGVRKAG